MEVSSILPQVGQSVDSVVDPALKLIFQILNVLAFTGPFISSGLTNFIYPTLEEGGEVARLISPAGYAFSIWGVIYSLLGLFVTY